MADCRLACRCGRRSGPDVAGRSCDRKGCAHSQAVHSAPGGVPPVLNYRGGVPGLAATAPSSTTTTPRAAPLTPTTTIARRLTVPVAVQVPAQVPARVRFW
ncbi:hypothetical protein CLOM_g13345 [Closterium sp. NIES-68]|nr:hypothetical protein CLOM_g13345 [Closterium sp. NIES-68]